MTDSTPVTIDALIGGRTVKIRRPNETQLALMHRQGQVTDRSVQLAMKFHEAHQAGDEGAKDRAGEFFLKTLGGIAEILDIIGFLIVEPEDVDWLTQQMKAGNVEAVDLLGMFEAFRPTEGKKPTAKKVAGASRARRTTV